jgi:hypothetical protein
MSSFPRSGVGTLFMPLRGVFKLNQGEYTGPTANCFSFTALSHVQKDRLLAQASGLLLTARTPR